MKLEKDNNYKWVTCPSCNHGWHVLLITAFARETVWCPECRTPLKRPSQLDAIKEGK